MSSCGKPLASGQGQPFCTDRSLCKGCGGRYELAVEQVDCPEARLLRQLPAIEDALAKALAEAAGAPMAYILFITPANVVGQHAMTSNIQDHKTITRFLRETIKLLERDFHRAQAYADRLKKKIIN